MSSKIILLILCIISKSFRCIISFKTSRNYDLKMYSSRKNTTKWIVDISIHFE